VVPTLLYASVLCLNHAARRLPKFSLIACRTSLYMIGFYKHVLDTALIQLGNFGNRVISRHRDHECALFFIVIP
jgi:hypothetical protein